MKTEVKYLGNTEGELFTSWHYVTQFQHGLECSGVYLSPFTFWSVTLQPVGTYQATMWQMKGDIPSFHMRYRGLISIHRLHRKINFGPLSFLPLVQGQTPIAAGALPRRRLWGTLTRIVFCCCCCCRPQCWWWWLKTHHFWWRSGPETC